VNVSLRYFAGAREATGLDSEELDLAEGASLKTLRASLVARYPDLEEIVDSLRFAVGASFADLDHELRAGDEVALIPPVGGG
jgi:molybdopterin converting factor subunit 1